MEAADALKALNELVNKRAEIFTTFLEKLQDKVYIEIIVPANLVLYKIAALRFKFTISLDLAKN